MNPQTTREKNKKIWASPTTPTQAGGLTPRHPFSGFSFALGDRSPHRSERSGLLFVARFSENDTSRGRKVSQRVPPTNSKSSKDFV